MLHRYDLVAAGALRVHLAAGSPLEERKRNGAVWARCEVCVCHGTTLNPLRGGVESHASQACYSSVFAVDFEPSVRRLNAGTR